MRGYAALANARGLHLDQPFDSKFSFKGVE